MSLKPLRITTHEAPKAAKSDIAIVSVDGTIVADYNEAVIALKSAEALKKDLSVTIQEVGVPALLSLCLANPDAAPSSIKLQDERGETVLVIGMNKYSTFDPEVAEPIFAHYGAKIEDHAQFVAVASFDSSIFLAQPGTDAGEEGKFSIKIFKAYQLAIDRVTAQLVRDNLLPAGAVAPLFSKQVAQVLPNFHATRWKAFPSVEAQQAISKVCPNVITLKPVIEREVIEDATPPKRKR